MVNDNNYQPKNLCTQYDSLSKALINTRDELGALILEESSKRGNTIEFPSLGIVIKPRNFRVED